MNDRTLIESLNLNLAGLLNEEHSVEQRLKRLDQILRYVVAYLTEKENIFFSSYFSRISFLSSKYSIPGRDIYQFHSFRKLFPLKSGMRENHVHMGVYVLYQIIDYTLRSKLNIEIDNLNLDALISPENASRTEQFKSFRKVYFKEYHSDTDSINVVDHLDRPLNMDFEDPESRKELISLLSDLEGLEKLPIKVSLFDIRVKGDIQYPSYYVLDPDFLIDVTSISESFDSYGISVAGYGLRKLVDKNPSISLHIGNIANVILDEMIYDPDLTFNYFIGKVFKINPLAFASFTNEQVRVLIDKVRVHYTNIKKVIHSDFRSQGITAQSVYVEPSYYAPRIGVQGRFDLLHQENKEMHIVELKSGKSYRPNAYGLNNSHYHQTLLYDLILGTNIGRGAKRNNFILYSAENERPLRYAPTIKAEQREAIKVRNQLLLQEYKMQSGLKSDRYIADFISFNQGKVSGFKKSDLENLGKIYGALTPVERTYWESSFSFLSREYSLSKVGDELSETNKGLSALWQMDAETKKDRFLLLERLIINSDRSTADNPGLTLTYSSDSPKLSSFRKGDIVILYPSIALKGDRLTSQVFKCTLLEISESKVEIRLRSKQMNPRAFHQYKEWNIEHDILDSSFAKTFRQLYYFAASEKRNRHLLLGLLPPDKFSLLPITRSDITTEKQHSLIEKAVSAQDYFLIWGPPGTGKTSVILKEIVEHYYTSSGLRILVLAYTNRAVDEMCEAIEKIDESIDYIRVGSRYGCGEKYKSRLLNTKIEPLKGRKEVKEMLHDHQIYVGTIASLLGKHELFNLVQFGVCIVDEASQILEASLVGILSKVKKFVLIGDHHQLPAIVLQNDLQSRITDNELCEHGFVSFNVSLFERLYGQAVSNDWHWAYSQLTEQGRMHQSIMSFVNRYFYDDLLNHLKGMDRLVSKNTTNALRINGQEEELPRMIFIPSEIDVESGNLKVNRNEAILVKKVVERLFNQFDGQLNAVSLKSIGVITPFRAQIALIKSELADLNMNAGLVTVDTVERYQGGSRDIIIISTVVNTSFQLSAIVSLNNEGLDRKLNVALTRAREQIIMIGNEDILGQSIHYKAFMEEAVKLRRESI